ncbi:MAG TPA: EamA family transporter [Ktedonobacterales bacterium]|nr:EamA family transporter [Ktedonobacterales bacterium]
MPQQQMGKSGRIPPHVYFLVSAVFHYLGPAFAVLLFAHVSVLGVAWLRIASAAAIFAAWRKPRRLWRLFARQPWSQRRTLLALGVVLAAMNACFYLAIARLPLGTVGAIEFLGPIALAAAGVRSGRNILALVFAVAGVWLLTDVRLAGQPLGFALAFANCALFMLYVVLGHRIAEDGGSAGIDRLGIAMFVALLTITPIGLAGAAPAFTHPLLLLAGVGVGICSSVIPYVTDQLAMARLPRATFALLLSLLPACATIIGVLVLHQIPTLAEALGVGLIICGVAVHREPSSRALPATHSPAQLIEHAADRPLPVP